MVRRCWRTLTAVTPSGFDIESQECEKAHRWRSIATLFAHGLRNILPFARNND
jgi:hypothetical protein